MLINADFDKRVVVQGDEIDWLASPMPGVMRRPLDRIGAEVARATTIVRYDPDSHFSAHTHDGGEEFLVLEGVFEDEHGQFPAGSYIRNPPTSRHTPGSTDGCVIFVKLWQFDPDDRTQIRIDTAALDPKPDPDRPGVSSSELFRDPHEVVSMENWSPGTDAKISAPGGIEVLVIEGDGSAAGDPLRRHTWLRMPDGQDLEMTAGSNGLKIWVKTGHLAHVSAPGG